MTTIVIVGASGDLARKKLIPALFSLYCNGLLPPAFQVIGFARTQQGDAEFRALVAKTLTLRYEPEPTVCDVKVGQFLKRCYYQTGQYGSTEDFLRLAARMRELSAGPSNVLLYMAIPPTIFVETARSIRDAGLAGEGDGSWARLVIEKPFGRDAQSSAELTSALSGLFSEEQIYRIDHYLGKEVIQNLLILRFGNRIFEPIWNRSHIESVSIRFSERFGVEGRAGYFDSFGMIRDVVQNHLLQAMALVAMEQPIRLDAFEIAEEKTKLLRATQPLRLEDTVTGRYVAANVDGRTMPGYLDDPEIGADSITETYVRTVVRINNPRWYHVPFYLSAGKALDTQKTEILITFRPLPYSIFPDVAPNTLLIRVQPNEAIEFKVNNKVPGMRLDTTAVGLDMLYHEKFATALPEAYERLLLDVLRGDHSLFIQERELAAAWAVVTPLLHQIEAQRIQPRPYAYGSAGPA